MFKKIFFLLFLISFSLTTKAQYTKIINSNHPGFSQSPYSVGLGVYQFETNLFHKNHKPNRTFDTPTSTGLKLDFRTSFFKENLELNLNSSLHRNKHTFKNLFTSNEENKFGLGEFTVGAKYLVFVPKYIDKSKEVRSWKVRHGFDWNRCIPHVGVYAGFNVGRILEGPHKKRNSAKVGVLLQHELDLRYNFVTNVFYDHIGTDFQEWSYILTSTYIINERWAGFLEQQTKFNKFENTSNAGGGLTYLHTKDLQFNSSVRATFQESGLGYHANLGVSYRIDKHVEKFTALDDFGNPIDGDSGKKKRGFFGRMYDSVKRFFVRSEKVEIDDVDEDGNPITKTVKIPNKERKREKSVLKKIVKKDKKNKKKQEKYKRKAIKKEKNKKAKAKGKAEKEKRKIEEEKIEDLTKELEEKEDLLREYQKDVEGEKSPKEEDEEDEGEDEEEIEIKIKKLKEEIELQKKVIEEEKKNQLERHKKIEEEKENEEENKEEKEDKESKVKRLSSVPGAYIELDNKTRYDFCFKDITSEKDEIVKFSFRGPKTSDFKDIFETIKDGFETAVTDETIKIEANGEVIGMKYLKKNGSSVVQFVKYKEGTKISSRGFTKEEIDKLFE